MPALIRRIIVVLFTLGVATVAVAQDAPRIARYVPPTPDAAHVFVLDSAHILSPETIAALQDSARALQTETQADVAWITLPTLGGRSVEEAALYIGRTWRIGSPGNPGDPLRNRGLVVLYIPDKTKTAGPNFRIEVGNGLEGTITDSRSRAISAAMREDLKAKHYDAAYMAGWGVAASLVREDFASHGTDARPAPVARPVVARPVVHNDQSGGPIFLLMLIVLAGIVLVLIATSKRRGGTRSGVMPVPMPITGDDDEARRRSTWIATDTSLGGFSGGGDSGGSSGGGGDFGGGGGFSGGGSSDTI